MTSKSPVRSCHDVDESVLSFAEVKALAAGDSNIKEKMDLDIQVTKLKILKADHASQKYKLEDDISKNLPKKIAMLKEQFAGYQADIQMYKENKLAGKDSFSMELGGKFYTDKKEAGAALVGICRSTKVPEEGLPVGGYQGFKMALHYKAAYAGFIISLTGKISHNVEIGSDIFGNIQRINNVLEGMGKHMEETGRSLEEAGHQLETAKREVVKPFMYEKELAEKLARLNELDAMLNIDGSASSMEETHTGEKTGDNRKVENDKIQHSVEKNNSRTENGRTDIKSINHVPVPMKERLALAKEKAGRNVNLEKKTVPKSRSSAEVL